METEITLENFEELWQSLLVRASDKYETPPDVIKIGECTIGTLGNFSASTGKSKSKKTFNVSAIVASAVMNGKILNYESHFPEGKRRILYFDTEQSEDYCQKILWRINRLRGMPDTTDIDCIEFAHLREKGTLMRRAIIECALATHPNVGLVIIDGLRDLLFDINSSTEAAEVIGLLMRWTSQYRLHIHTVLHQNKGDDNVRGHIGTELNHKAESILQIVRSKKDGNISEVHASYTRDREFKPFAFKIDAESRPVLVADYDFETNTARAVFDYECLSEEAHRAALDKAFERVMAPIGYNELIDKLKVGYASIGFARGEVVLKKLKIFLVNHKIILVERRKYMYNRQFHYVPLRPDESSTVSSAGI